MRKSTKDTMEDGVSRRIEPGTCLHGLIVPVVGSAVQICTGSPATGGGAAVGRWSHVSRHSKSALVTASRRRSVAMPSTIDPDHQTGRFLVSPGDAVAPPADVSRVNDRPQQRADRLLSRTAQFDESCAEMHRHGSTRSEVLRA